MGGKTEGERERGWGEEEQVGGCNRSYTIRCHLGNEIGSHT